MGEKENDVKNNKNEEDGACDPKKNDLVEKRIENTQNVQCVNMMEKPIKVAVHIVRLESTDKQKVDGSDNRYGEHEEINEEEDDVKEMISRRKYPNFRRKTKSGKNGENIEMNEISPVR